MRMEVQDKVFSYNLYTAQEQLADKAEERKDENKDAKIKATQQEGVLVEISEEGYKELQQDADEIDNVEEEKRSGKVAVNEGKRLRQIAAAKTPDQIQLVISLLQGDVSDCQAGLTTGMCDEAELKKAKALLQKAIQKKGELIGTSEEEQESEPDVFGLTLLM